MENTDYINEFNTLLSLYHTNNKSATDKSHFQVNSFTNCNINDIPVEGGHINVDCNYDNANDAANTGSYVGYLLGSLGDTKPDISTIGIGDTIVDNELTLKCIRIVETECDTDEVPEDTDSPQCRKWQANKKFYVHTIIGMNDRIETRYKLEYNEKIEYKILIQKIFEVVASTAVNIDFNDIIPITGAPGNISYYARYDNKIVVPNVVAYESPTATDDLGNILRQAGASQDTLYLDLTPNRVFKNGTLFAEYCTLYRMTSKGWWEEVTDKAEVFQTNRLRYEDIDQGKFYWDISGRTMYRLNLDKPLEPIENPWTKYGYKLHGTNGNPTTLTYDYVKSYADRYFFNYNDANTPLYRFNVKTNTWETFGDLINYFKVEELNIGDDALPADSLDIHNTSKEHFYYFVPYNNFWKREYFRVHGVEGNPYDYTYDDIKNYVVSGMYYKDVKKFIDPKYTYDDIKEHFGTGKTPVDIKEFLKPEYTENDVIDYLTCYFFDYNLERPVVYMYDVSKVGTEQKLYELEGLKFEDIKDYIDPQYTEEDLKGCLGFGKTPANIKDFLKEEFTEFDLIELLPSCDGGWIRMYPMINYRNTPNPPSVNDNVEPPFMTGIETTRNLYHYFIPDSEADIDKGAIYSYEFSRAMDSGTVYRYDYTVYLEKIILEGEFYERMFQFYQNLMHAYADVNDTDRIDHKKYYLTHGHPGKTLLKPDMSKIYLDTKNKKIYRPLENGFREIPCPFDIETVTAYESILEYPQEDLVEGKYYLFPKTNKCYLVENTEDTVLYSVVSQPGIAVETDNLENSPLYFKGVYRLGDKYYEYNPYEEISQEYFYFNCDVFY